MPTRPHRYAMDELLGEPPESWDQPDADLGHPWFVKSVTIHDGFLFVQPLTHPRGRAANLPGPKNDFDVEWPHAEFETMWLEYITEPRDLSEDERRGIFKSPYKAMAMADTFLEQPDVQAWLKAYDAEQERR